jgi:hypothetical protein
LCISRNTPARKKNENVQIRISRPVIMSPA